MQSHRSELLKGVNDLIASVIEYPLSAERSIVRVQHTLGLLQSSAGLTECLVSPPTSPSLDSVLVQDSDLRGHTRRSLRAYRIWRRMLGSCPHSP